MKPVRRVEFDEDFIQATGPIRNARPTDIKTPSIRALHRSESQETIIPTRHRIWFKDDFTVQSLVSAALPSREKKVLTSTSCGNHEHTPLHDERR